MLHSHRLPCLVCVRVKIWLVTRRKYARSTHPDTLHQWMTPIPLLWTYAPSVWQCDCFEFAWHGLTRILLFDYDSSCSLHDSPCSYICWACCSAAAVRAKGMLMYSQVVKARTAEEKFGILNIISKLISELKLMQFLH